MKKLKTKMRKMKQRMRAWLNAAKKKLPSWMMKIWSATIELLLCVMFVELSAKALPVLAAHKIILAAAAGKWIWPLWEKMLRKIKEMR